MKNDEKSININHNPNLPYIPNHPYMILIISVSRSDKTNVGGSRSGKTNVLLNLIKHQRPDIDKIYLYVKDPLNSNY